METLIILIGAIIILGVAFYMAREKSYLPPEEMVAENQVIVTDENVEVENHDQPVISDENQSQALTSDENSEPSELLSEQSEQEENNANVTNKEAQEGNIAEDISEPSIPETTEQSVNEEEKTPQEPEKTTVLPTIPDNAYTVQVGYFSLEKNARNLANEIENNGFQTFVFPHNDCYKVQVGSYGTRTEAQEVSRRLEQMGYEIWVTQR